MSKKDESTRRPLSLKAKGAPEAMAVSRCLLLIALSSAG